jgi:hypothetical protein
MTPTKRTARGQGCPWCFDPNRSRIEVDLLFELKFHFPWIDPNDTLVSVPETDHRVDVIVPRREGLRGSGLIVEYDGSHWHRDKLEADTAKTSSLTRNGWMVVRVREGDLPVVQPELDVRVPEGVTGWQAAYEVVDHLQRIGLLVPKSELRNSPFVRLAAAESEEFWQSWLDIRGVLKVQEGTTDLVTASAAHRQLAVGVQLSLFDLDQDR